MSRLGGHKNHPRSCSTYSAFVDGAMTMRRFLVVIAFGWLLLFLLLLGAVAVDGGAAFTTTPLPTTIRVNNYSYNTNNKKAIVTATSRINHDKNSNNSNNHHHHQDKHHVPFQLQRLAKQDTSSSHQDNNNKKKNRRRALLGTIAATTLGLVVPTQPQPVLAKTKPVLFSTRVEAMNAIQAELDFKEGTQLALLQQAVENRQFAALLELTKSMDVSLRKQVLGAAKAFVSAETVANSPTTPTQYCNNVTFDLIGMNRYSRPGQEQVEQVEFYFQQLQKDMRGLLHLLERSEQQQEEFEEQALL